MVCGEGPCWVNSGSYCVRVMGIGPQQGPPLHRENRENGKKIPAREKILNLKN